MKTKKPKTAEYFLLSYPKDIKCSPSKISISTIKIVAIQWHVSSLKCFPISSLMSSKYQDFNLKKNLMKHQQLNLRLQIWNSVVLRVTSILEGNLWKIILNMWKYMIKIVFSKINGWEISNKFKISNPKISLLSWLKDQSNKDFLKDSTWLKMWKKVLPNLVSRYPKNLIPILWAEEAKDHYKTVLSSQWSITAEIWSSGIALLISIKRRRNLRWELKVWTKISGKPWEKCLKSRSMRNLSTLNSESKRRVKKFWKVAIQIF